MSYDESDAAYDAYMDQLFRETEGQQIAADAIAGFQDELLQSYFVEHPTLLEPAVRQLNVARLLLCQRQPSAALVFAESAVEVGLKQALFKPIVYGLVHSAPAAVIIAELSLGHAALDCLKTLVLDILAGYAGTDLRKYTFPGATKTLWEEIQDSQEARNAIPHRGKERSSTDADVALRSAPAVLEGAVSCGRACDRPPCPARGARLRHRGMQWPAVRARTGDASPNNTFGGPLGSYSLAGVGQRERWGSHDATRRIRSHTRSR